MISLIITLAVIGLILWLIEAKIPMDSTIKVLIQVIVVIAVIVYLLRYLNIGSI